MFWIGLLILIFVIVLGSSTLVQDDIELIFVKVISALTLGIAIAYLPGLFHIDSALNQAKAVVAMRTAGAVAALLVIVLFHPAQARDYVNGLLGITR